MNPALVVPERRTADEGASVADGVPAPADETLLTVQQAARILGFTSKKLLEYVRRGELGAECTLQGWVVAQADIDWFLAEVPYWVLRDADGPFVPEKRMDFSGGPPSKAEEAVTRLRQWIVDAAAKKPRDPLGPDSDVPKRVAERARRDDGRFTGPRVNVDKVPRLPTFPARWALEDPRRRPYLVFWRSSDGGQAPALKLTVGEGGDTVVLTMPTGMIYRLGIRRRPLPRGKGTALFYLCPRCEEPRRHLYLWIRAGAEAVDYFGLRCRQCAKLLFRSQGRYIQTLLRDLLAATFGRPVPPRYILGNTPWDPGAVSDPRLVAHEFPPIDEPCAGLDGGARVSSV